MEKDPGLDEDCDCLDEKKVPKPTDCPCPPDSATKEPCHCIRSASPHCFCPRNNQGLKVHDPACLLFKNEEFVYPPTVFESKMLGQCDCEKKCKCCKCPAGECTCKLAGAEAFEEWRKHRHMTAMPAVLESTHPLMQRFQETLKSFLEKENAIAEEQILSLRDELKLSKQAYDEDLESIYRHDHDTNAQRVLIEEYESILSKNTAERIAAEQKAKDANDRYKKMKDKRDEDIINEREALQELEALTGLCRQMEQWREETESDLTVSQRMSDKMKAEKKALADEKRQLDMVIYRIGNEVWKLESQLELFKKQMEIKNAEMDKINDKVTAYSTELEDLELDKRRLVSLWNSVLVNIKQRDKVYDSVREDYRMLQENYRTLINNLETMKKELMQQMNRGKELAMNKDKLNYDVTNATKLCDAEDAKRISLQTQIVELTESIEMTERDQNLVKSENQTMSNILKSTEKEFNRKLDTKLKLENDILTNLQDCLLNDKAVESMANGIKKMREITRKQELALISMENQHAKVMLDIEVYRSRHARNNSILEATQAKVRAREKEIDDLQEKFNQENLVITRKQRELDVVQKKYVALKEIFDTKSPQERGIDELEQQIRGVREHTEELQHEWLRLQGHVVKLAAQQQKLLSEVNLINKQIQICEQKSIRIQAESENIMSERRGVERTLRDLQGRLEVLERTRKDAAERNHKTVKINGACTYEFGCSLKDAESEILQLEEEIEELDKEKINLTQELDRVQREALIWQRKGILAVELKKNISDAKSSAGEIGQMRTEIHRMEVRCEQLRRTGEKLAEDLALYVTRRETAMDKTRAAAAVERTHGAVTTSQTAYHHKLRLAKADVARVTKDLSDAKGHMKQLEAEHDRLSREVADMTAMNGQLEENVATLLRDCREADRQKQWLLERVIRNQRLGNDLAVAVKRQSIRVKKPKLTVLHEYKLALAVNDKVKHIVDRLSKEFIYMEDKWFTINNTLNIHSQSFAPKLIEDAGPCDEPAASENVAEKPFCMCKDELECECKCAPEDQ